MLQSSMLRAALGHTGQGMNAAPDWTSKAFSNEELESSSVCASEIFVVLLMMALELKMGGSDTL